MIIPDQFSFIKWLKNEETALVHDDQGRKIVLNENSKAETLKKFSDTVLESTRILRHVFPEINTVNGLVFRNYIAGEVSGDNETNFGFTDKAFLKIKPEVLAGAFLELRYLSSSGDLLLGGLEQKKTPWYLKSLEDMSKTLVSEFDSFYYESITGFFRKYGRVADEAANCLVNGDVFPANIYINCLLGGEGRDFVIADWNNLHFNNPGFDLAGVYVWAFRNSKWREEFLTSFKNLWQDDREKLAACIKYCQVYHSCLAIKIAREALEKQIEGNAKINAESLLKNSRDLIKKLV